MASESTTPPPPSGGGGGAKYGIIGVALFAIAALVWCVTRPPDESPSEPVAEAAIDAGVVERSTALVEDDFEIPELEPDAGPPPDAGVAVATHRPRPSGGGGGAWDQCTGDIPVAEVRRVFGDFNAQIRNCYERQLKHNPLLQGNMTLALRVAPDGRVEGTQVSGSLHDREVFACVRSVSQRMRFPAPGGRDCAVIQAPFNFTPQQ